MDNSCMLFVQRHIFNARKLKILNSELLTLVDPGGAGGAPPPKRSDSFVVIRACYVPEIQSLTQ